MLSCSVALQVDAVPSQEEHCAAPAVLPEPRMQLTHSTEPELEVRPPAAQVAQAAAPRTALAVPGAHNAQTELLELAYVPLSHFVALEEPALHREPAGQGKQAAADTCPLRAL